jgi:SSS family solute:Na+ symporter
MAVPLAVACLVVWGVPVLRRAGGADVYAAVERRLGRGARRTLAGFFLVGRGLGAGVILLASARVVAACSGWSVGVSVLVVGTVAVGYTALGGLIADVFSDVMQFGLLWGATAVATVVLWIRLGGGTDALEAVDPGRLAALRFSAHGLGDGSTFGFWPMLIGGFFLYLSYYGCDQTQAQRVLAAAGEEQASRALAIGALVRFPLVLTYCLFGVMLAAFLAATPEFASLFAERSADDLVPLFLVTYVPVGVVGVVVAGILAAALSSVDSAFNSLSAVTVEEFLPADRFEASRLGWARRITVGWGVFAMAAAVWFSGWGETTIEIVNRVGSALYGPVLAVFLMAWRSRRADGRSAVAGAFAGLACNLVLARFTPGVSWLWWNVFGCGVAVAVGWAFGRATAEPEPPRTSASRGLATVLVAYFFLILLVLLGVTLAV